MQFIPFLSTLFFTSVLAAPKPVPQTYTECELVLTDYPVNTCPLQPANGGIGDYCDAIGKSYGGWSWGDGEVSYQSLRLTLYSVFLTFLSYSRNNTAMSAAVLNRKKSVYVLD